MGERSVNLALSGWSGAGTSTLTLILAKLLKRRYIYLGGVFREVGKRIGYLSQLQEDADLAQQESYYQPIIGRLIDDYVDHALLHQQGIILETDLAAFRLGKHEQLFSIFLKASLDSRVQRAADDGRADDPARVMQERDEALRQAYLDLWQIDVFDEQLIAEQYTYVLDTSVLSLTQVVHTVVERLREEEAFGDRLGSLSNLEGQMHQLSQHQGSEGKLVLQELLVREGLLVSVDEILVDIAQVYPGRVAELPAGFREVFGDQLVKAD